MLSLFFNPFKKPSARSLAQQQLEEAQRQKLTHESAQVYHQKMAEYYRETENRLIRYTGTTAEVRNG